MVAIIDALEAKGIIARRPDAEDRRRNVVELTPAGQDILRQATAASDAAEAELLASLSPEEASSSATCWRGFSPVAQRRSDRGSAATRRRAAIRIPAESQMHDATASAHTVPRFGKSGRLLDPARTRAWPRKAAAPNAMR
jgi:DNA-binding PadR family transcriptional regulator